jgi:hypothetical protein
MRQVLCILVCAASACSEAKKSEHARTPTPGAWMHRLIAPARPCLERFRDRLPDPYFAQVRLTRADDDIAVAFESGDAREFNACVIDAVRAARVSAHGLDGSIVVPFAFSVTDPAKRG